MNLSFKEEADTVVPEPRGEDELRFRAGETTGMRRGASLAARRSPNVRAPFERLESRLLLSATDVSSSLSTPYIPDRAASVLLLTASGTITPIGAEVPILSAPILSAPILPTPILSLAPLQTADLTSPPAASRVQGPTAPAAPLLAMLSQAKSSGGGLLAVISTNSGDAGQEAVQPLVLYTPGAGALSALPGISGVLNSYSAAGGEATTVPSGGAHSAGPATGNGGGLPVQSAPYVPAKNPSTQALSSPPVLTTTWSSLPSGGTTTSVPVSRRVEVEGEWTSDNGYLTLQIPVGPTTRELGLSVHSNPGTDPAQIPVIGQMSLVDRNGATLAHLGPLANSEDGGATEAVTLELDDVPAGGTLLVQLAARSSIAPGATSSATAGPAAGTGSSIPFVMDVQRVEAGGSSASIAALSLSGSLGHAAREVVGTFQGQGGSSSQGTSGAGSAQATVEETANPGTVAVVDPAEVVQTGVETASDEIDPSDVGARVATGPLAARTAGPLGPNLSNVMIDPAPAADRHERALSQELADNESEGADAPGSAGDRDWTWDGSEPADVSIGADEMVASIAGLGPLPLKDSAAWLRGRAGDLGALDAALSASPAPADGLALAVSEDRLEDPLLVALASTAWSDGDRRPTPDYLTSACILAVGMGLITGPIIPDLLRLIPQRSSRWTAIRPAAVGNAPIPTARERVFGPWLRRRMGV